MKKLKFFLLLFAALVSAGTFTACSDDDDNQNQSQNQGSVSIVGTWVSRAGSETLTLTFGTDGSFVETYQDGYESETDYGTYSYDGTTLTLVYSDGYRESGPATLSGNTLTIDGTTFVRV